MPIAAFGKSTTGIEWNSPDGKPTHFIFLILTPPEDDAQLQILAFIADVMGYKGIRDAVMEAKDSEEIWDILQKAFTVHHVIRG